MRVRRYYAGPLQPLPDAQQHTGMQVSDDGTVLFVQERFEVGVRPQTDAELNRLYPAYSKGGMESYKSLHLRRLARSRNRLDAAALHDLPFKG